VKVKSTMDRETAETITLKILVTDVNAWDPQIQTATGNSNNGYLIVILESYRSFYKDT